MEPAAIGKGKVVTAGAVSAHGSAPAHDAAESLLPPLRQDLRLLEGAPTLAGVPTWLIYDPVRHRYFQIDRQAFELLQFWNPGTVAALTARFKAAYGQAPAQHDIEDLLQFLHAGNLTDTPPKDDYRAYFAQSEAGRKGLGSWLLHSYLFIRIPLLRPQRFLERSLWLVEPLFSAWLRWAIILIGLVGLYLASRQWDEFVRTFLYFFTLDGAAIYAISLALIKVLHELGHAYTATRHGVRVNTMGVALMVMFPVLYTDVSDAWRLKSRRARFEIDSAGIKVELSIAALATFAWAFLPDGPLRSAAFFLATAGWLASLAINLNPMMRFDGYYLLSDLWGIENLQSRSFALARWSLRETLFGLGAPAPEPQPAGRRRLLVVYAGAVWVYRFFLFLGIALVVYHLFFKVLGIALFAVEVAWFIALPVWREMKEWWKMRQAIMAGRRTFLTAAALCGLVLLALVPWRGTVIVPAVLAAQHENAVYLPAAARLESIEVGAGDEVAAGQILFRFSSRELDHEAAQSRRRQALLQARLGRIAGDNAELANRLVIEHSLATETERLAGIERQREQLNVRAPIAGVVRDLGRDLHAGRWIARDTRLAAVISVGESEVKGLVAEDEVWRLDAGAQGVFIPEIATLARIPVRLDEIAVAGSEVIDIPYLASIYGGRIAANRSASEKLRPDRGQHLLRLSADGSARPQVLRGVLHLEGRAESIATAFWRQVMRVFVREAGV